MEVMKQADSIHIFSLKSPHMRTFHLTWFAFFISFLAWFGIAPLMIVVREEFGLSKEQIGNIMIASVFFTIFARIVVGFLYDRFGPRWTYTGLLAIGSLPVFGLAFSKSYESLLIMRFLVGGIGAAFVITQYHTTVMFSPKVVGTANATTAGWGNLGGGVSQILMPVIFSIFILCAVKRLPSGGRYQARAALAATLKHIASPQGFRYIGKCSARNYAAG